MTQTLDTFPLQTHKSSGSETELTASMCSWEHVPFSAVLRNGPVAAAHKDSINQLPCHWHRRVTWCLSTVNGSVCAGPTSPHRLTIEMGRCLSYCCHRSKHMFFGRLPHVSCLQLLEENMKAEKRHTQWYLLAMVFVIAWQCELISNVLKMNYWLRRWKSQQSAEEHFSFYCSQKSI